MANRPICSVCRSKLTPRKRGRGFYDECALCHKMKAGIPVEDFKALCSRICIYQNLKLFNSDVASKVVDLMDRPATHPLCITKRYVDCVAKAPKWSKFQQDLKEKGGNLTQKEWKMLVFDSPCYACGFFPAGGVDRIDPKGRYTKKNCAPFCAQCNLMKNNIAWNMFKKHACLFYDDHTDFILENYIVPQLLLPGHVLPAAA